MTHIEHSSASRIDLARRDEIESIEEAAFGHRCSIEGQCKTSA